MSAPRNVTPEQQIKFMFLCVKYSNHGKVNWDAVAEEHGNLTKGAAAKRWERLVQSNGYTVKGLQHEAEATVKKTPTKGTKRNRREVERDELEAEVQNVERLAKKVKQDSGDEQSSESDSKAADEL